MTGAPAGAAGTISLGEVSVNRLGFGAMQLIGPNAWGGARDAVEARRVLRRAVELGVNLIDTAYSYGPETNERLVADALLPYPADLVIATKSGFGRSAAGDWRPDCRPQTLRADCQRSLHLLGVESLDVLQLHTVDPDVPIEESVGTLTDLQREGKVRAIGVANVSVDDLERASAVATIVSVQNRFSVLEPGDEEVLTLCERRGIPFLPWFPLGGSDARHGLALAEVASRHSATSHQVAIAWLLRRSPAILPIPGTSSVEHLEENVAATELELSDDDMALLAGQPS
jgi:pyridoxine 4-dehydrogenase